jgi:putative sensor protein
VAYGHRMSWLRARVSVLVGALDHLVGGLGTAALALGAFLWAVIIVLSSPGGVGLALAHGALRAVRWVANRERARLTRWGSAALDPGPVPDGLKAAAKDPFVRRELAWLPLHAICGLAAGVLGLALPLWAVQDLTFPLW